MKLYSKTIMISVAIVFRAVTPMPVFAEENTVCENLLGKTIDAQLLAACLPNLEAMWILETGSPQSLVSYHNASSENKERVKYFVAAKLLPFTGRSSVTNGYRPLR